MIFFFKSDGTLIKSAPDTVYQGSTEAGKIYVVMPFNANAAADVYFRLPNGENWGPYILTNHGVVTDSANLPTGWGLWSVDLESAITQYAGTLTAQFGFYQSSGDKKKVPILTTQGVTIKIAMGVVRDLPEKPTDDIYAQIIAAISEIHQDIIGMGEHYLQRTTDNTIALKNNGWIGYSTEAAANTIALRDSNGRLKAVDGVANDDVATVKQLNKLSDATNLENGTGASSVQQKYVENGVDYSAQATGKNAAAFGGKRYDMLSDTDRTPTSAEGNQAFAAGGSVHAMADFATAFGKDGVAYQRGSFVAAMKGQAGLSEEEFNNRFWDSVNNKALHDGKGKDSNGNILDSFGKTYKESYSTAVSFGDDNKARGYGDFTVGSGNTSDGLGNFTTGSGNIVDAVKSFTGGEANTVAGDIGNSITYGQRLKNTGRWNKTTLGQFNAENKNNILEIGGGESENTRKNIFEVDFAGNTKAKGTATFGNGVEAKYVSVNGLIWAKDYIRSNIADAYIQLDSVEKAGYLEWGYGSSKNKTRLICGNYAGGAAGDNVTIIYMPNKAGTIAFQDYVEANFVKKAQLAAHFLYAGAPSGDTIVYLSQTPTESNVPQYTNNSTLRTNAPIADKDAANKQWVEAQIAAAHTSVYTYKGSKDTYANLPATGNKVGDVWNVEDTGINYAWNGADWDSLSANVLDSMGDSTVQAMSQKATTDELNKRAIVVANPTLAGTETDLTGLQVGDTKYKMPASGGGKLYRHSITFNYTQSLSPFKTQYVYVDILNGSNTVITKDKFLKYNTTIGEHSEAIVGGRGFNCVVMENPVSLTGAGVIIQYYEDSLIVECNGVKTTYDLNDYTTYNDIEVSDTVTEV